MLASARAMRFAHRLRPGLGAQPRLEGAALPRPPGLSGRVRTLPQATGKALLPRKTRIRSGFSRC